MKNSTKENGTRFCLLILQAPLWRLASGRSNEIDRSREEGAFDAGMLSAMPDCCEPRLVHKEEAQLMAHINRLSTALGKLVQQQSPRGVYAITEYKTLSILPTNASRSAVCLFVHRDIVSSPCGCQTELVHLLRVIQRI